MNNNSHLNDNIIKLLTEVNSLQLATITNGNTPLATYTPFSCDENYLGLWILISELSQHAQNLALSPKCSIMIIRDEQDCAQIYARERVQFEMQASEIERQQTEWTDGLAALKKRHGKLLNLLEQLADFRLFYLSPKAGRYVIGFGQAYELVEETLSSVNYQLTGPA